MTPLPLSRPLEEGAGNTPRLRATEEFVLRHYSQILVSVFCVLLLTITVPALWSFALAALLAIVVAAKPVESKRSVCLLDFAVFVFYASSCISTALAYDVTTALPEFNLRTLFLLFYLTCRWTERPETTVVPALAIGMIIRCVEGLITFVRSYVQWSALRFTSLTDFRSSVTLTAAGVRPGNHAAIYIVAIANAICALRAVQRHRRFATYIYLPSLLLSLACVVLSLSRALYLCTAICLVISIWDIRGRIRLATKTALVTSGGAILALLVLFFCARPIIAAMGDTILFASRQSQTRSVSGRLSINRAALHLATRSGWIGSGLSNYALAMRRLGLMTPSLLTAHTFNVALQIAIEQGLFGIASLLLVIAGVIKPLWQDCRKEQYKPLLGGAAALFLFSMSQSFVFADQATATTLAVYSVLIVTNRGQDA